MAGALLVQLVCKYMWWLVVEVEVVVMVADIVVYSLGHSTDLAVLKR